MIHTILPDAWLDVLADAMWAKRTGTEFPATVTVTGNPVSETTDLPRREIPSRTATGNPVTTSPTATGNPVSDRDGKSRDKALDVQPENKTSERKEQPANQPFVYGRSEGLAALSPLSSSPSTTQDEDQWTEFLKQVKENDDIRNWMLYGETEKKVMNAVKEHGSVAILEALDEWKEARRPPVSGLDHPWQVFLRECADEIKSWSQAIRNDAERRADRSKK